MISFRGRSLVWVGEELRVLGCWTQGAQGKLRDPPLQAWLKEACPRTWGSRWGSHCDGIGCWYCLPGGLWGTELTFWSLSSEGATPSFLEDSAKETQIMKNVYGGTGSLSQGSRCHSLFWSLPGEEGALALITGRALEETAEGRAGPRKPLRWRLHEGMWTNIPHCLLETF